jgi:hypothetical protein
MAITQDSEAVLKLSRKMGSVHEPIKKPSHCQGLQGIPHGGYNLDESLFVDQSDDLSSDKLKTENFND